MVKALWGQNGRARRGSQRDRARASSPGFRLGVVSSGTESRVFREIEQAGLAGSFAVVICNEHVDNKKPHPEGLEIAIRRLSSTNQECGYVGDAPEDIQMGKRANVLTIAVRSSYPSSARLLEAKPDIYLESIGELPAYFPRRQLNPE